MSADNGIYILKSPGSNGATEFRVAYAMAIDNITYGVPSGAFNDKELQAYFGKCEVIFDKAKALEHANSLASDLEKEGCILEYGISFITMNRPFPRDHVAELIAASLQAVEAAEFVIRCCEADLAAGNDPSPFRRSDPNTALAECYGAMVFVEPLRKAIANIQEGREDG